MYSNVDRLLARLLGRGRAIELNERSTNNVIALLYYMAVLADGRVRDVELEAVRTLLTDQLGISEDELFSVEESVMSSASSMKSEMRSMERLRDLPLWQRKHIVENLKAIALADREFHETEINLIARTIKLLLED